MGVAWERAWGRSAASPPVDLEDGARLRTDGDAAEAITYAETVALATGFRSGHPEPARERSRIFRYAPSIAAQRTKG